ncbi:MAG: UDP-2,4-diacetamido-2,4,6-trideoxy-beta-L-altropyranose hydrolase, partial [bacterium]
MVIRADAGPEIGIGHVLRALTLGQAWREAGGQVDFVTANATEPLITRLEKEEFFVHLLPKAHPAPEDWQGTARALTGDENPWLVLDGYNFDAAYHERAREAGVSILVVDDMAHLDRYAVDIVLNQNAHARSLTYEHPPETRL